MTIKDTGSVEDIINEFKRLEGKKVEVGILEDGPKYPGSNVTVLDVANFNEYGTSRIPARPFIRGYFDNNYNKVGDTMTKIVDQGIENRDIENSLNVFADWAEGETVEYLKNLTSPPNSPVTIKIKGSSSPLIDTGQLMNSIKAEVD